jgi:hypothetical protein
VAVGVPGVVFSACDVRTARAAVTSSYVSTGYDLDPDELRAVLRAWAKPVAREELRGLGVRVKPAMGTTYVHVPPEDAPYILSRVAAVLADQKPVTAVETAEGRQEGDDKTRGTTLPTTLIEEAVRLKERDRLGRRKLDEKLHGLGDWGARVVLYWHEVGKPAGLWLEDDRLRWGPAITEVWDREQDREQHDKAIAPTPRWLSLPRP